jgi:WD40 repeat protein
MSNRFGSAKLYDAFAGSIVTILSGSKDGFNGVLGWFSPDGKGYLQRTMKILQGFYDAGTGQLLYELKRDQEEVFTRFSPDGKRIISYLKTAWEKYGMQQLENQYSQFRNLRFEGFVLEFNSDGTKIFGISRRSGKISIWNAGAGQLITEINAHKKFIFYLMSAQNGKKIVTISEDSTAKVWNTETGALLYMLKEPGRRLQNASFSSDGSKLFLRLSERINGTVITKMWDAETGDYITELNQEGSVRILLTVYFVYRRWK